MVKKSKQINSNLTAFSHENHKTINMPNLKLEIY